MIREYGVRLSVDRANEVRSALRGIGTEGTGAFRGIGDQAGRAGREVVGMRAEVTKTSPALQRLDGMLGGIKGQLLGLAAGGAILGLGDQVIKAADKFASMRSRIGLVVREGENLLTVERNLAQVAFKNNSDLEGTVTLYQRLRSSRRELSDEKAQKAVDTWNKLLIISGSSATEAASSTLQFAQALGGGALRGAELNSVIAGNIRAAQLFSDTLGIGLGELKKYGEQGKITTQVMLKALTEDTGKLAKEFDAIALTNEKAGTNLSTAWTRATGVIDKATGFSATLAKALNSVADGVLNLADSMGEAENPGKKLDAQIADVEKQVRATDRAVVQADFGPYAKSAKDAVPPLTAFERKLGDIAKKMTDTGEAARNLAVGELSLSRGKLREEIDALQKELDQFNAYRARRTAPGGFGVPDSVAQAGAAIEARLKVAKAAADAAQQRLFEILKSPTAAFRDTAVSQEAIDRWAKMVEDARTPVEKARAALKEFDEEVARFPDVAEKSVAARGTLVKALKDAEEAAKKSAAATKEETDAQKDAADAQKKWAGVVEQSLDPAQKLRAQVAELSDDYLSGKLTISEYVVALDALNAALADAGKQAASATPEFQAVAAARENITKAAMDALTPTQKIAAEQERLNGLIGVNGFTAEEASEALSAYARELGKAEEQASAAAGAQVIYTDAVNGSIQSFEDLEDVALRALEAIARQVIDTARAMKASSFSDYLAATAQVLGFGGRAPAASSYSAPAFGSTPSVASLPASIPSPVYHDGGVIGPRAATRVIPFAAFQAARRHHSGLWPGMYPGERTIIAQDGERMFSRMHNERIVRAVERGGEGGLKVEINNYAGAEVTARETRGPDGSRKLLVTVNRSTRQAIASGGFDEAMRQRYGLRPVTGG